MVMGTQQYINDGIVNSFGARMHTQTHAHTDTHTQTQTHTHTHVLVISILRNHVCAG